VGAQRRRSIERDKTELSPDSFPSSKTQSRRMNELLDSIDNKWPYSSSLKSSFQKGLPFFAGDPHAYSIIILLHLSTFGHEDKVSWSIAAKECLENFSKELKNLSGTIK